MKTYYFWPAVVFNVLYLHASGTDAALTEKLNLRDSAVSYVPGVDETESSEELDEKNHPCIRKCGGKPKTCYYHFHIEWYQSMSKACYDCPFNSDDCERKDCVVANGLSRQITVINRKMPGPTIQVCQNDKIIVNVTNDLMAAGTVIHWHGMHQRDTPYMDGVPFVTQCPIQPESTFTYEFTAAQAGTNFYHSHIGLQRGDGVSGALIVRQTKLRDPHSRLYTHDEPEHLIQVHDWSMRTAQSVYTEHYHSVGSMSPTALLINGRGRFEVKNGEKITMTKAPRFDVTKFGKYRFRFINSEFYYCPVELSVDGHEITVIASDGYNLEPVTARSLVSYAGERFDFIIEANQKIDNYWIRVRGLLNCANKVEMRQVAVLHYRDANDGEPDGALTWEPRIRDKLQINPENQGEEQNVTTNISKLKAFRALSNDESLKPEPDYKFYVAYDLYIKDNDHFNKASYYGHEQVNKLKKRYSVATPQLNHISMKQPTSPLLVSRPPSDSFCNGSSVPKICKETFCQCPHVLSVKLNSVVEVIIIDEGTYIDGNHPFHLHGHSFRVVGQRRLGTRTSAEEVIALDRAGKMTRNLRDKPPLKDTVSVPDGGYTIIRFKASNPGYWLFHCHIEFHAEVGMALVFKVGEHEDMTPVPLDFPMCGDYKNKGGIKPGNSVSGNNGGSGPGNNVGEVSGNNGGNINNLKGEQNQLNANNMFANVADRFNAYHSIINMPMGGQMDIVYKPTQTGK